MSEPLDAPLYFPSSCVLQAGTEDGLRAAVRSALDRWQERGALGCNFIFKNYNEAKYAAAILERVEEARRAIQMP